MPPHDVVAHEPLRRRPVLARHRAPHRLLVERRSGQRHVRRVVRRPQGDGELAPEAPQRVRLVVGDGRVHETRAPDAAAGGATGDVLERGVHELHRRGGGEHDAVGERARQLQRARPRGGQHDRHVAAAGPEAPALHAEELALVGHGLAAEERAHDLHRLAQRPQRAAHLDAGIGEIVGRAGADAERDAAGRQLVERGGAHGDVDGMNDVRAHRHQRHAHARGGVEHGRGHRERVAQEEVARHPDRIGARGLRRLRLLAKRRQGIATVERHAERHRTRLPEAATS